MKKIILIIFMLPSFCLARPEIEESIQEGAAALKKGNTLYARLAFRVAAMYEERAKVPVSKAKPLLEESYKKEEELCRQYAPPSSRPRFDVNKMETYRRFYIKAQTAAFARMNNQASEAFERLMMLAPWDGPMRYNLAIFSERVGYYREALHHVTCFIILEPQSPLIEKAKQLHNNLRSDVSFSRIRAQQGHHEVGHL